jgi:peroxiredoxin
MSSPVTPLALPHVCSANHVPEYIQKLPELRAKGVDQVAVLAYNDAGAQLRELLDVLGNVVGGADGSESTYRAEWRSA